MKTGIDLRRFKPDPTPLNLILLSALLVITVFLLQGDVGLNLQDEGFLWYGTIRTALGEVPVRDFQSYDPGRYYWGAIWFKLLRNDGILALRISQAVFQFLGLTVAFLLLRRVLQKWLSLIVAGLLLLLWMFPPWKIYEQVIMIAAIYFAVLLIEKPTKSRHFIAGVFIGLAAFFGRNHGMYCFVAFLLLILFVWWRVDRQVLVGRLAAWSLGIALGYLPMLLMFAFVPGFFNSYLEGIVFNLKAATTLPTPVPWPWRPNYSQLGLKESIHIFAVGLLYLLFPIFYLFASVGLLFRPKVLRNNLLIASTFVGAIYLHYTFSRPHLYYLAWTIPPFIFGLIAVPYSFLDRHKRRVAFIVWSSLLILSWITAGVTRENYFLVKGKGFVRAQLMRRHHGDFGLAMQDYNLAQTDIRGDKLWITNDVAEIVNNAKAIDHELIPANDGILVAPYWTALYPILRKQSPTWEIYFLFPQPLSKQQRIVEDLDRKHVNWAMVCHYFLDGRPELAFENTHSYVWRYLTANFETIRTGQTAGWLRDCELMHRTGRGTSSPPGPYALPSP